MKSKISSRLLLILVSLGIAGIVLTICWSPAFAKSQAETIDNKYLVMKGTPGTLELSNFIKLGMEPIGHTNYIYGGGWNEADDGGGIEANTIGVAKSWKDFERKQDSSYDNNDYDYEVNKQAIHYGLDCSAYVGWVYYNMFNDGKDHVTFACDMGNELVDKGLATKTRSVKDPEFGQCTFKPGDIMTSGGHVWISLGKCSDGSVLTLQSQGQGGSHDKYEGVSIYGTTTPDGSKDSEAIKLANEYLGRYYPLFHKKYMKGYSWPNFLTSYNEYTWNIADGKMADTLDLQNKSAKEVMELIFGETKSSFNISADSDVMIKVNDAVVQQGISAPQKINGSQRNSTIKLYVPYSKEFTSININGIDFSNLIPKDAEGLNKAFFEGYTCVEIPSIALSSGTNTINVTTTPASKYGVGTTKWQISTPDKPLSSPSANKSTISHASFVINNCSYNNITYDSPIYYSGIDWVNDSVNGYGAFPVGSKVTFTLVPEKGYEIVSFGGLNVSPSSNQNEYQFVVPAGDFNLNFDIQPAKDKPSTPEKESEAEPNNTAKTGDPIREFLYRWFRK